MFLTSEEDLTQEEEFLIESCYKWSRINQLFYNSDYGIMVGDEPLDLDEAFVIWAIDVIAKYPKKIRTMKKLCNEVLWLSLDVPNGPELLDAEFIELTLRKFYNNGTLDQTPWLDSILK